MESFKCNLMCFSTFQSLELASESETQMQSEGGIKMLYEPGPWDPAVGSSKKPVLHVGYLEHVLQILSRIQKERKLEVLQRNMRLAPRSRQWKSCF